MDSLRLILLIIGLVIVLGVYFKFRSSDDNLIFWLKKLLAPVAPQGVKNNFPGKKHEVSLEDNEDLIPVLTPIDDEPDMRDFEELSKVISTRDRVEEYKQQEISFSAVDDSSETGPESLLVILNIMSPANHYFTGEGIHAVMTSAGLEHGEHNIYHYMKEGRAVFSIANVVEPGFFELSKLSTLVTPGLAVFMQLPGPLECRKALDELLEITKRLASALQGELCDENRSVLTQQTISHLRDKVETYRLKQQTAQRRNNR